LVLSYLISILMIQIQKWRQLFWWCWRVWTDQWTEERDQK
jgi:hypothetical protein